MPTAPRILKTNPELLRKEIEHGKIRFAGDLGVHLTTLHSLLDDSWQRIERDTIERLCDHFNCDMHEIFRLEPSLFWEPFRQARPPSPTYRILRGIPKLRKTRIKRPLEEPAKSCITEFIRRHLPKGTGGSDDTESEIREADILKSVRADNCIVIGADASNPSCEVTVCRLFGARPYEDTAQNRSRIPFRLIRPDFGQKSAFVEFPQAGADATVGLGIYSEQLKRVIVEVSRWSDVDYDSVRTDKGHDAAIILIANRPFQATKNVKLIVLAGFTRIGTLAAAKALEHDFRDLEPVLPNTMTVGVIDATFRRKLGDDKELRDYNWVYLEGGRRTILPKGYPAGCLETL